MRNHLRGDEPNDAVSVLATGRYRKFGTIRGNPYAARRFQKLAPDTLKAGSTAAVIPPPVGRAPAAVAKPRSPGRGFAATDVDSAPPAVVCSVPMGDCPNRQPEPAGEHFDEGDPHPSPSPNADVGRGDRRWGGPGGDGRPPLGIMCALHGTPDPETPPREQEC